MLKGRFRRLHYGETKSVKKAIDIVCAACVLHNMCVATDDEWDVVEDKVVEPGQPEGSGGAPKPADGAAAV